MRSITFVLLLLGSSLAQMPVDSTRGGSIGLINIVPDNGFSLFLNDLAFIRPQDGCVTDSVVWKSDGVVFAGKENCKHDWAFSESSTNPEYGYFGCGAMHGKGEHCSYDDKFRNKICRACLREEREREHWYQHYVVHPKTEFELLKEKQATLLK